MSDEYLTIIAIHRQNRTPGKLIVRVHKKLLLPSKVALGVSAIMLFFTNLATNKLGATELNIYHFIMGIMFGLAMPLLVFGLIEKPILLLIFIYGIALAVM